MDAWYSYREITYTKDQIIFLLRNMSSLTQGVWPPKPSDSGYVGQPHGRQFRHEGNFVRPVTIIAELNARLRLCGIAGLYLEYLTLIDYEDYDYMLSRLAGYTGTTPREVAYLSSMALRYCCYPKRKESSFKRYCIFTRSRDNEKQRVRRENHGS